MLSEPAGMSEDDGRMWGALCHVAALVMFIGIPFGNIIGPLIIWLLKGKSDSFVDDQGREAINFNITVTLYYAVAIALIFFVVGLVLLPIIGIVHVIFIIIAAIKSRDGVAYRYPFTLRLLD